MPPASTTRPPAWATAGPLDGGGVRLQLGGRLTAQSITGVWNVVEEALRGTVPERVVIDGSEVTYCDTAGLGILMEVRSRVEPAGGTVDVAAWPENLRPMLDLFDAASFREPVHPRVEHARLPEEVGRGVVQLYRDLVVQLTYVGELTAALGAALLRPHTIRWRDALRTAETAGVNALPIVVLIGFLLGLIMAFQSAIPMKQFGAEIFVANLVSLSMLRELGPLMTAIVLAGRSGSAFAAEIGTMKVNEEVNALVTMGLKPVNFLVVPRVLAAVVMTPLLTLFTCLAGLLGGIVVMLSLGFPFVTAYNQMVNSTDAVDLLGGLVKAFFFGILVAGVGCMRGLETKTGASAVGDSTTRAVVSSIVLIAIADGIFSVVYYFLGV
ncbi:MAG: phospholipid/cholesterol/gamma-HCH transport system permease protein [Candidatus Sumerlaeota bacterium]|nr:phospholipid/cholesterol/gamma-HCH transport system permease protein [Candidatus Sumerlaeota bacterium]